MTRTDMEGPDIVEGQASILQGMREATDSGRDKGLPEETDNVSSVAGERVATAAPVAPRSVGKVPLLGVVEKTATTRATVKSNTGDESYGPGAIPHLTRRGSRAPIAPSTASVEKVAPLVDVDVFIATDALVPPKTRTDDKPAEVDVLVPSTAI